MPSNSERFNKCSDVEWHVIRKLLDIVGGYARVLGHTSAPSGKTDESKGVARISQAALTRPTASIVDRGLHTDLVADFESCDALSDLIDDTTEFMSEDGRKGFARENVRSVFWSDQVRTIFIFMLYPELLAFETIVIRVRDNSVRPDGSEQLPSKRIWQLPTTNKTLQYGGIGQDSPNHCHKYHNRQVSLGPNLPLLRGLRWNRREYLSQRGNVLRSLTT
jgi:hypothetical protein